MNPGTKLFLLGTGVVGAGFLSFLGPGQNIHGSIYTGTVLNLMIFVPPIAFVAGLAFSLKFKSRRSTWLNGSALLLYALWVSGAVGLLTR